MALNIDTLGLSATITAQGISAPDYQTILSTLTGYFQQIYGTDAYLEPDSKDGQLVALIALALHDANNTAIACYQSFSPATSYGAALARNVKLNGITRHAATSSTVDVTLTGAAGTTITNGSVKDVNGITWNLPSVVSIGINGTVTVTATCSVSGAVAAIVGSVTTINTPTLGWTSANNATAASIGSPVETDSQLRLRQSQSVALPSLTPFAALDGAIANISGVSRHKLYENDTGDTDSNGLPPHSISAIVDGGDVTEIGSIIYSKKGQGVATYGSTSVTVSDVYGNPHVIKFSRPSNVPVYVSITIKAFNGYTTQTGENIKSAITDYINSLTIGDDVLLSRIYSPANLGVTSGGESKYYDITSLMIGRSSSSLSVLNIETSYYESATCSTDYIRVTVA